MTLTDAVELYISRRQAVTGRFQSPAITLRSFSRRCKGLSLRQVRPTRESQRGDQAEDSGITTLFHSDQNESGAETSDIQTLFSDNDSSSP